MLNNKREIYILRHGETEWSKSGQHTSLTDLPLTNNGEIQAKNLNKRLSTLTFDYVFSSPLKRALETCRLCGLENQVTITNALLEWNYGNYEGKKSTEIHQNNPGWNIFEHGAPNGETPEDIQKRADNFIQKLNQLKGRIALFSSGHFSRALTVRFLDLSIAKGRLFMLSTASLSILSYEQNQPTLQLWNDISHHFH